MAIDRYQGEFTLSVVLSCSLIEAGYSVFDGSTLPQYMQLAEAHVHLVYLKIFNSVKSFDSSNIKSGNNAIQFACKIVLVKIRFKEDNYP